jgi:asparagine synthase (glutamine-hydrolysing)
MSGNGKIEKYILRKAFEDYLPMKSLGDKKEQFSDGVGYGWIDTLKMVTSEKVSDEQLKNASFRFPINTPKTKEEYYYRSLLPNIFRVIRKQLVFHPNRLSPAVPPLLLNGMKHSKNAGS